MNSNLILIPFCVILVFACSKTDDPSIAFQNGDYERAFELWKPLADKGNLDAQNHLGVHFLLGLGVDKDYQKANEWYEMAARQGHADAQRNYGDMIYNGLGIQQDYYKAFIWYFASSQQGNESAKNRLEALSGENKLTPNQQMHGKIEANKYINDPSLRFMSHDTYVDKEKEL